MFRFKSTRYFHFDSIDSTSSWAKKNAASFDPEVLTCIVAEEQTAGHGQFNRSWFSPKGGIYASLFLCLPKGWQHLHHLTQLLALSVAKVLETKGLSPHLKEPNDVLLDGKKVAGVLTEIVDLQDRQGIVLGIGINVDISEELLSEVDQPAISLRQATGEAWGKEQVLTPLIDAFILNLKRLDQEGFAHFEPIYQSLLQM